jgi:hypothetical protein
MLLVFCWLTMQEAIGMQPNYLFVLTWDFIIKNVDEWEAFPVNYYMGIPFHMPKKSGWSPIMMLDCSLK